jgi:large conductance mechanosensitive channel
MPPIGVLLGGVDFSDYYLKLTMREQSFPSLQAARDAGAAVIAFGSFINAVIKFLIVAFAVFLLVKQFNHLKRMIDREVAAKPEPAPLPPDVAVLTEIRDILKARPTP